METKIYEQKTPDYYIKALMTHESLQYQIKVTLNNRMSKNYYLEAKVSVLICEENKIILITDGILEFIVHDREYDYEDYDDYKVLFNEPIEGDEQKAYYAKLIETIASFFPKDYKLV